MPRGMDDNFHRFVWITLVVVAFTFTLILTSVFVDIDDLLAKRSSPVLKQQVVTEIGVTEHREGFESNFQEFTSSEEDTEENESTFRTKRSLESNKYLLEVKNPKVKKILTNRLATLLQELDEEESSKTANLDSIIVHIKDKNNVNSKLHSTEQIEEKTESTPNIKDTNNKKITSENYKELLHLALHNILLQGIVRHMDLNDVYKKVQMLVKSFENNEDHDVVSNQEELTQLKFNKSKPVKLRQITSKDSNEEEDNFFNELIKCDKLQKQISRNQNVKIADEKESPKDLHMLVKTTIEVINNYNEKETKQHPKINATDSVHLVYNGKEIKAMHMIGDKDMPNKVVQDTRTEENQHNVEPINKKEETEGQNIDDSGLDQAIKEYLRTHSVKFHNKYNVMTKSRFVTKRLKRQIKIRYLDNKVTTEKSKKIKEKSKQHDDDLYVEIETHFDGKGMKGEKKKKLVRTLIDKIQKAINSNVEVFDQNKTMPRKHLQIKKRFQNPIDHTELILNTKSPIDVIEHRQLNPISKTGNRIHTLPSVLDKTGENWKKMQVGPTFLTSSKSLNSAEMGELDVDYKSVMENGIPKRLQKPINTENENTNDYSDVSTLFLKDINGSGFTIGINQYADEPPDKETLKMFMGLENIIQSYHKQYDRAETISNESELQPHHDPNTSHKIERRDVNNYKTIHNHWFAASRNMDKEIANYNSLLGVTQNSPYKRSVINVKFFSNIKTKTKLNKFINTNAMSTKKIFHKSKRNKRQLDKIKILASERYPLASREDVYLMSRENIYSNRAVVKEEETPEVETGDKNGEHYDFIAPYRYNMDIPDLYPTYLSTIYDTKSVHSGLMSKYPHMFIDNIRSSKDFSNASPSDTTEEKRYQTIKREPTRHALNYDESNEKNVSSSNVDEIVNAILPSKNNYKVVVKIIPKNNSNVEQGYKEIRTLINKTFDKNGVRYVSSLNVSEISKVENINKTKNEEHQTAKKIQMEYPQNQIKLLLELHKERIDQQLKHLKMESQKLKQVIGQENSNKSSSDLVDKLTQFGLKFLYEKEHIPFNVTPIFNTFLNTTETTTNSQFTTTNKQEDAVKIKILSSIKESENITREILQKIDQNTNLLQIYIKKLLDQKQSTPAVVNTEKIITVESPKYLADQQLIHPLLGQLQTNYTNAIPFIYAFQHPLTEYKNKPPETVANIVYHGHIHADKQKNMKNNDFMRSIKNTLQMENYNINNNNRGNKDNETKFFIDDLENDFKIISNVNDRPILPSVKSNNTQI